MAVDTRTAVAAAPGRGPTTHFLASLSGRYGAAGGRFGLPGPSEAGPASAKNRWRRTNFWIFPEAVRGKESTKTQRRGTLKEARRGRRNPSSTAPSALDAGGQTDEGHGRLAPAAVGHADHGHLGHGRVGAENVLDLDGEDVLTPAHDHLLAAAHHAEEAGRRPG